VGTEPGSPLQWWPGADALGAAIAITTRWGGTSEGPYGSLNLGLHVGDDSERVVGNRRTAARSFGVALEDCVFAEQVHGATVTRVAMADAGRGAVADRGVDRGAVAASDALVTTEGGLTLVIMVADCVPVALVDPVAGILAVVHAGWRGTAAGVAGQAVRSMIELGAQPEQISAYIGPAVAPERYQVDRTVFDGLTNAVAPEPLAAAAARPDGPDHWRVDLPAANRQQLQLAGVLEDHITDSGATTSDDDYFSDRAARPCGRFALLARLLD
jgi:YfiH family protein